MLIGLTGGIGCGKSTVLSLFKEFGFGTIDCDTIGAELIEKDTHLQKELLKRWGKAILKANREVDRKQVAAIVFRNTEELSWLEGILHPMIHSAWQQKVAAHLKNSWVIEVPLLFEKNLAHLFEQTICVTADKNTCIERLAIRGLSTDDAQRRMACQFPLEVKQEQASFVISNNGTSAFLRTQVQKLILLLS